MVTELRNDRNGLGRFNVTPAPVVRAPARNPDGSVICPECGSDISSSRGTQRLRKPDFADRTLQQQLEEPLLLYGWLCTRHQYDIVIPAACRGRDASNLPTGWIGVRLVFTDEIVRWAPTPRKELREQGVDR